MVGGGSGFVDVLGPDANRAAPVDDLGADYVGADPFEAAEAAEAFLEEGAPSAAGAAGRKGSVRVGDPVIQLTNDYDNQVLNGELLISQ